MSTTPKTQPKAKQPIKADALHATNDLPYDLVTSFRLKRSKPKQTDQLISFLMDSETFKQIQLLGIKYGVSFDEVLKGLSDRELSDVNNGSTLSHWIPVLNL